MKKNEICSIICSFNPNQQILSALCQSLSKLSIIYIIDNSFNLNKSLCLNRDIHIILPEDNLGTLRAYNFIISQYPEYKYFWLWNQDTIITEESANSFLQKSISIFNESDNIVATTIFDKKNRRHPYKNNVVLVKESTTLFNANRIRNICDGWFDENLFMDYGDWLFSQNIISKGGKIIEIDGVKYKHILGEPEKTLLGSLNRSSVSRLHMQGLNTIYILNKYGFFSYLSLLLLARIFFIPLKNILFKKSFLRTKAFYAGIYDGIKGELSINYIKNNY